MRVCVNASARVYALEYVSTHIERTHRGEGGSAKT